MDKFTQQDWATTLQLVKLGARSLDVTGQNYILAGVLINKLENIVTPPEEKVDETVKETSEPVKGTALVN